MTMINEPLEVLGTYQGDISNLRSHHWKYWADLYTNCYYDCAYCAYRSSGPMGKVVAHRDRIEALRRDVEKLNARGIVYLGPKADVYQPLERKEELARRALEVFLETRTPIFIVTRSELIRRDIDLLSQLAKLGLVEASVTIASTKVLESIEPHTPTLERRLNLIQELKSHGIATSVHLSPIMPHFDDVSELQRLLDDIAEAGADCSYACVMGLSGVYYRTFSDAAQRWDKSKALRVLEEYPGASEIPRVQSASQHYILSLMDALSRYSTARGIPFACVHIPPYDTAERNGGIFRFKLPTVGDIVRHLSRIGQNEVRLRALLEFASQFKAVDDDYLQSLENFWHSGELFKNTYYHPHVERGEILSYVLDSKLDLGITNMVVGKKVAHEHGQHTA